MDVKSGDNDGGSHCRVETLYHIADRDLLTGLLSGEGGFHGPAIVLNGLSAEQAVAKPDGLPHSIAEIVAHMCYWQEWFNGCARAGFTGALPVRAGCPNDWF